MKVVATFAICLFCAVAGVSGAMAEKKKPTLTKEQKNVLKHYAEATAIAHHCPTMQVNEGLAYLAFIHHGLTGAEAAEASKAIATEVGLKAAKDAASLRDTPETACGVAMMLYGPSGVNVKNFMIPR